MSNTLYVTLDEVKAHLRIDDNIQDTYLSGLTLASQRIIETHISLSLEDMYNLMGDIDPMIKQAILLQVGFLYANAGDSIKLTELPQVVSQICFLWDYTNTLTGSTTGITIIYPEHVDILTLKVHERTDLSGETYLWNVGTNDESLVNKAYVDGISGVRYLTDLLDVAFSGVTEGDVMYYSGGTWTNTTLLTDLQSDMLAVQADIVALSGQTWQNASDIEALSGATGAQNLDDLNDVDTSGVTTGQALIYSGGTWVSGDVATSTEWGGITGTLSNQTDLQNELDSLDNDISTVSGQTYINKDDIAVVSGQTYINKDDIAVVSGETYKMGHVYNLNGFDELDDESLGTLSWDNATRTLSISPASGYSKFWYYVSNIKYEKTATESIQLPDVTGMYYIYFTGENLAYETYENLDPAVFYDYAIVGLVYWNSNTQEGQPGNERHGIRMDSRSHEYHHDTVGALYETGLDISGLASGNDTFSAITIGKIWDEDIRHTMASPQTEARFMYLSGSTNGTWYFTSATDDLGYLPAGASHYVWNENTGSEWKLTEGTTSTDFFCTHFMAMPTLDGVEVVKVIGQNAYANKGAARDAIYSELQSLSMHGLVTPEVVFLYTVIIKRDGTLVALDDGSLYLDHRYVKGAGSSAQANPVVWGDITGTLSDQTDLEARFNGLTLDDLSGVTISGPTESQVLRYSGSTWVNATAPAGATTLDGLTDVTITSASDKDFLQYNASSSEWENVEGEDINDNVADGQVLYRNGDTISGMTISSSTSWGDITGTLSNQTDLQNELDSLDNDISSVSGQTYQNKSDIAELSGNTSASWGDITGTLSNQTDLQDALDLKLNTSGTTKTVIDYKFLYDNTIYSDAGQISQFFNLTGSTVDNTEIFHHLEEDNSYVRIGTSTESYKGYTDSNGYHRYAMLHPDKFIVGVQGLSIDDQILTLWFNTGNECMDLQTDLWVNGKSTLKDDVEIQGDLTFDYHIESSSATTYTIADTDNNRILEFTTGTTITLPTGTTVSEGFSCTLMNFSDDDLNLSTSGTLRSKDSMTKVASKYAGVTVYYKGSDTWVAFGDLSS